MTDTPTKDAKLVQYLNEANAKEKELEAALAAHIAMSEMADRKPYKKKLQEHLRETKSHSKALERRIKKLGGAGSVTETVVATAAKTAGNLRGQAVSAAKGPLHMVRGTSPEEKLLKNAKTEYWNEHEEIATYMAIETLAEEVGDKETAKLARDIRRDEEKMARYLERLIPTLTKAVVEDRDPGCRAAQAGGSQALRSSSSSSRSKSRTGSRVAASSRLRARRSAVTSKKS